MTTQPQLKHIIEAAIFAAGEPLSLERLKTLLFDEGAPPPDADWEAALCELAADYEGRVLQLQKVASGYRFQVREAMAPHISRLWEERPARYTRALLETLALVAYRQPITRGEIEDIRGVSVSTQIFKTLQDREWVRVVGHRDVPGRPALYATTRQFLDYFNLRSLDELPPLSALKDLDQAAEGLNFDDIAEVIRDELQTDAASGGTRAIAAVEAAPATIETVAPDTPIAANEESIELGIVVESPLTTLEAPNEGDVVEAYLANLVDEMRAAGDSNDATDGPAVDTDIVSTDHNEQRTESENEQAPRATITEA